MNDTPGWASPGSADSGEQDAGVPRPAGPADENGPASKWSTKQPPAGQWSAPSGPPGQNQHGATPPPGWGGRPPHGGWGPQSAAKPGVIPLRPLGVGEILDGAVSTLRAHWRTVLGITITVSVISQTATILGERYLLPEPPAIDKDADDAETLAAAIDASTATLSYTAAVTLIATLFTTALLTVVISRSVLGRPVTLAESWREARPRLAHLFGLTLLLPLMAGGIMFVAVLPGLVVGGQAGVALAVFGGLVALPAIVWLLIRFALASPALMLERQGVFASMRRSAKLVQGAWWRTFGILSLTVVLTLLVSMIIAIPFSMAAFAVDGDGLSGLLTDDAPDFGWPFLIITGIGGVISSSITYPISAGVTALLYIDQRIRREALDIDLARAAGVPGYGDPSLDSGHRS
ncbi:hypothetical protein ABZ348_22580 [Streptomyces sp. NPDC005963]|uniref:DUF7544 domain-containing protein n=1 Tax=Streptomyces sp. NPDC005963 TaxID=3156721 RepID=UPI0033D11066